MQGPWLIRLGSQNAGVGVLDEGRDLTEAQAGGEGGMHCRRVRLVGVAEPALRGDRVQNHLGSGQRGRGMAAFIERDDEVGEDLTRDAGGEVGGPFRERTARVGAGGDLPGDRQPTKMERLVGQHPLGPAEGVGADVEDGAAQDLTVFRCLVASADDHEAGPAEVGERVGDGVVQMSVVTGQVTGTDPVRGQGTPVRGGRVEQRVGIQGRLQGLGAGLLATSDAARAARRRLGGSLQVRAAATSDGRRLSQLRPSRPSA